MRSFDHKRPERDKDGKIIGHKESPVGAVTRDPLGGAFGSDKKRRLVVTLCGGDVIRFRPHGTRRTVDLRAVDAYRWAIQCEANRKILEKARAKKAKKAEVRERRALDRMEKKLRQSIA